MVRCVSISFVIFADQECLHRLCPHAHPSLPRPQHSFARSMDDLWWKKDVANPRDGSAVPKLRSRQTKAAVASWPYLRPPGMPAMMPPLCDDAARPLKRSRHEQQVSVLKPSLASQVPTTSASSSSNVQGDMNPFDEARTESSYSMVSAMDSHTPPHLHCHQRSHPTTRALTSAHAPWLLLDPAGLPVGRLARQ